MTSAHLDSTGGPYGLGVYLTLLAVVTVAGSIAGRKIFDRRFAGACLPSSTVGQDDRSELHS